MNFGVTVESVEPARETPLETDTVGTPIAGPTLRPTVRLKTGEMLHADVIIGADGRRSIVRRVVNDEDEEPELDLEDHGLAHQHRLKSALQRRILLDVFLVFVQRGRADCT